MKTQTPWGQADQIYQVGLGIYFASTPSHGGYFVPNDQLLRIPPAEQAYAARWSGSPNWFEEDCCAVSVLLAFPELFPPAEHPHLPALKDMLSEYVSRFLSDKE